MRTKGGGSGDGWRFGRQLAVRATAGGSGFLVLGARFVFGVHGSVLRSEPRTSNLEPRMMNRTENTNREPSTWNLERRFFV
jgi:hypothetical protein